MNDVEREISCPLLNNDAFKCGFQFKVIQRIVWIDFFFYLECVTRDSKDNPVLLPFDVYFALLIPRLFLQRFAFRCCRRVNSPFLSHALES